MTLQFPNFSKILSTFLTKAPSYILAILIIIVGFILANWIRQIVSNRIKPQTKNPLLADFIGKLISMTIKVIAVVVFFESIGLGGIFSSLLAGAGIATFVIGFAFKDLGENFLSGVLLAFKSPFGLNDLIESEGIIGYVSEFNIRETVIKTLDGKDVFVPNSQIIKSPLVNYTVDGFLRYEFVIGIDYDSDIEKTILCIEKTLASIPEVIQEKEAMVVIDELAASTVNIKVYYWINTFDSKSKAYHIKIRTKIICQILKNLSKEGIYLPADIIEVKNHRGSSLLQKTL